MELNENENGTQELEKVSGVLHSEADLEEKDDTLHALEEEQKPDYSTFTKKQLAELSKELAKDSNAIKAELTLREIRPLYDEIAEKEKAEAKKRFLAEGGLPDDFEYRGDEFDMAFDANARLIRDKKHQFMRQQEEQRNENLRKKEDLLEKMRELLDGPGASNQYEAFQELQKQWKSVGQVAPGPAKTLWANYHALVDRFYDNQSIYFELKELDRKKNLELKNELIAKAEKLLSNDSLRDAIKELNELHHEFKHIGPLQKAWELIGGIPRAKAKDVNKKFWNAFKSFFHAKNTFFKKLDEEREANLKTKQELLAKAIQLKESSDWDKAANELKGLQQRWKDVGPVPEKVREKIFKEFKEACDFFFDQKRGQQQKADTEQTDNLKQKEAICLALETAAADGTATQALLEELQAKFAATGFVPRNAMNSIRDRHSDAVEKFVNAISGLSDVEKAQLSLKTQLSELKNDPFADKKIQQKEQNIRKKISKVENDIALWKNNLEFFARSKNADSLRDEVNQKIKTAEEELTELKKQLKLIRSM
ncbi:MAG: DUF349 domain-containing protein [Cytophagia bacterium]|nr:DUF349 domain-containing protein [Cytophagia bacterium]